MPIQRRLRAYFAGSPARGLCLVALALAVLAVDLLAEAAVPRWLPQDGDLAAQALGGVIVLQRLDDARTAANPYLVFTWPLFALAVVTVLLPLAVRLRRYGWAMVVGLGLGAGGSLANLVALTGAGVIHNWLGFAPPGGTLVIYSLADLVQMLAFALLIVMSVALIFDEFWLQPHVTARQRLA